MVEPRINDPQSLTRSTVQTILDSGYTPTIQFSKPGYSLELLRDVNRLCIEFGDGLEVRFYGHYQEHFDALVLSHIPDVQWLSVDCLRSITNESQIGKLPLLNRLSFGVFQFDKSKLLEEIDVARLTQLALSENVKRNFDLAPLVNAKSLHTLSIAGHSKNIEAVSSLPKLTELTLRAFPKSKNLEFVCGIKCLLSLSLILGGRTSIKEFHHESLEALNIIRVRGLESIGSLGRFPKLHRLSIQDQLQIRSIDLSGAALRRVELFNCKNLTQIEGLDKIGDLVEFRTWQTNLELDHLVERAWPSSLEVLALYSKSKKWNDATRKILSQRGYRER